MLNKLTINNVALIKSVELEFSGMLNILSGETGAGKSIIVDSLMLLLGERYDKTILRYGQEKGFVEGVFTANDAANEILDEFGFDKDDTIIVTRRFFSDGKNEIRINGRTAAASMLKKLMSVMVDIYGQNEFQSLEKTGEHLRILQYYVRHTTSNLLENLAAECQKYRLTIKKLNEIGDLSERERNIDMLKYQIAEIEKAKIKEGEEDALLERRRIIASAEKISGALNSAADLLMHRDNSNAVESVSLAKNCLSSVADFSSEYEELFERIDTLYIELKDIAESVSDIAGDLEFDASELDRIDSRLDKIRSIKRKYGDFEEMQKHLLRSKELCERLENCAELYESLLSEKNKSIKIIHGISKQISDLRKAGAVEFETLIEQELASLGMAGAKFKIEFLPFPSLSECEPHISTMGMDKIEFYLSANAGQPLKPLVKVISGGEMSRLILAIKVISSRIDDIPTMIFDEIDTGISGRIGQEVAKKLAIISRKHQVLCVTHLPQIASMADSHYYISKTSYENDSETFVKSLDYDGAVGEISRLSGAKDISLKSDENAAFMKKWSDDFKSGL